MLSMRRIGKRALRRFPRAYSFAKRWYGAATYALAIPHERDFALFQNLEGQSGLFVDVGANAGQSARSLRIFNHTLEILSFEPNRLLEPELAFTRRLLGPGYSYQLLGLGSRAADVNLHVPVRGTLHTAWATIDRGQLQRIRQQIEQDLGGPFTIVTVPIQIVPFDDLDLHPLAIKIDVEGLELDVLKGMRNTLERDEPILLIEGSAQSAAAVALREDLGYSVFAYDPLRNLLGPDSADRQSSNYFACTPRRLKLLRESGGLTVAQERPATDRTERAGV